MEYRRDMMLFKILKYCGNKVKAMENEIWVGTFREVVAYTKEREKNRLNVLENGYDNSSFDMNAQLFTEPLTMVLKSVGNRV